jgi:hypothetical protein
VRFPKIVFAGTLMLSFSLKIETYNGTANAQLFAFDKFAGTTGKKKKLLSLLIPFRRK